MAEHETATEPELSGDKPRNGLAGLKHWRHDLPAGIMVALVALPFSVGIALASGAPPVCGIISAIVAGCVLPFVGGSYVTVAGPAAGLAPAVLAGILTFGHGDAQKGYLLILVGICLAGLVQIILAKLKVAQLSAIFPAAAIEGMLVAIGLIIIVKQFPLFLGQEFEAREFWEILRETPGKVATLNPQVFWLGGGCLVLLFALAAVPTRLFKLLPPVVWVFFGGTIVAQAFLHLDKDALIAIPEGSLASSIALPDFRGLFGDPGLWLPMVTVVITLVLIGGTEALATISAVDKIDPFRRKSDPDQTLLATGVCNMCSSVLGGLTIIPGIVKSTANILGGGRTQWASFYNACCLLLMLVFARGLINLVPKCILAAILVYIGFKLCRPRVWFHMARIGKEQFLVFAATVLITVSTDLLIGIVSGVALKMALVLWYIPAAGSGDLHKKGFFSKLAGLFRNPVRGRDYADGVFILTLDRPLVCFNLFHLIREMDRIPAEAKTVRLSLSSGASLIDHTTYEQLLHYLEKLNPENGKTHLEIKGLERLNPVSSHESCLRFVQPHAAV